MQRFLNGKLIHIGSLEIFLFLNGNKIVIEKKWTYHVVPPFKLIKIQSTMFTLIMLIILIKHFRNFVGYR